ncbi:hypothetical protein [Halobacillus salinus]|uniref:hypothetical protein n=1 Tax=Halobacillus salinus TaxID=192814 RepID=UPI001592AC5A|nr:hypothetical protein [Halobacillus salinus]
MNKQAIPIPYIYKGIAQETSSPGETFKRYVEAYVRHNFPGWKVVRIKQMNAICKKE